MLTGKNTVLQRLKTYEPYTIHHLVYFSYTLFGVERNYQTVKFIILYFARNQNQESAPNKMEKLNGWSSRRIKQL